MNLHTDDISVMLDELGMTQAAIRWNEILDSPEFANYSPQQLLREVITPQYVEAMNRRYLTNLRFSGLVNRSARIENLKTGGGRRYNDAQVEQLRTLRFLEKRMNLGIYGVTGAGKSYFMAAFCDEACRQNYRCRFINYCDLLDELMYLNRQHDLMKYRKRMNYYSRVQILCIDDFAISKYPEEGIKVLYQLIQKRTELERSTLFTCQYEPSEWGRHLCDEPDCFGKLDGIRRRITSGYNIQIEKD